MAKKVTTGIVLPSSLAFLRSVEPTPGLMFSVAFNGEASLKALHEKPGSAVVVPVPVTTTTVRGTITNDHAKKTPAERVNAGAQSVNAANIATVEQALLPADAAHLLITTVVRFSGHAMAPGMCNSPSFSEELKFFLAEYAEKDGFKELAVRYLLNIANASWLWRNRFGQNIEVRMGLGEQEIFFSEDDINMAEGFTLAAITSIAKRELFNDFADQVADALAGGATITLDVSGLVNLGAGAEVYPSQEFASEGTETARNDKDKPGKILSKQRTSTGSNMATIHARKIGNALRTIDTWHGHEDVGAIAIDVFGANTHQGEAYRVSGNDLYTYLRKPEELRDTLAARGLTPVHHYVVACLVRGGVYGFASAAKNNTTAELVES